MLVEFNPEDRIAFGYVRLGGQPEGAEWGYVDLDELAQVYVAPLVIVERDLGWRPRPAGEVIPDL